MRHFIPLATFALVLAVLLAPLQPAAAQTKTEKIRRLLEISQVETLLQQVLPTALQQTKASLSRLRPDIPEEIWARVMKEAEVAFRESISDFIELTVPIYERNFTEEEIDGMLSFYSTPVGRSVIKKLPKVTQESMVAGRSWGMSVGQKVHDRMVKSLADEGYKI